MALLLAMFRTLVDEGLEAAALAERLNVQVSRHSPASRFITLFFAACDPATGRVVYVNAGHMPGLLRRRDGTFEQLSGGGIALGMFEQSKYEAHETTIEPGDTLVLYSDGVTEAENHKGQAFEESGLERRGRPQRAGDARRPGANDPPGRRDARPGDLPGRRPDRPRGEKKSDDAMNRIFVGFVLLACVRQPRGRAGAAGGRPGGRAARQARGGAARGTARALPRPAGRVGRSGLVPGVRAVGHRPRHHAGGGAGARPHRAAGHAARRRVSPPWWR